IIQVTVKTLKQKEQFEVAQSSTIQEFKKDISERFKTPCELLVLIFAGKVLKDQDTLSQHGVCSGVNIHLVVRSPKRPRDGPADQGAAVHTLTHSSSAPRPDPPGAVGAADLQPGNSGPGHRGPLVQDGQCGAGPEHHQQFLLGVTGTSLLGLDTIDVSGVVSSIQSPDASMHSLRSAEAPSTFGPSILSNLGVVSDIIISVPQVQQLAEQNPEINHILSNPHTIREMLEAYSSPAVMQEMIRNQDLAMSNLESIPGGYSALEQLYREIEEPILDAVQTQMEDSVFAALDSSPPLSGAVLPARTENRQPLPNPWAPQSQGGSSSAFPWHEHSAKSIAGENIIELSVVEPSPGGVQSMVQQLTENSVLMQDLESTLTNPEGPVQVLLNSDQTSGDRSPSPQEQCTQPLPPEMENAEISALLRNPRALRALLQVQLGLQTLTAEVPELMLSLG
ncbi:UBQL1 protein, partial [Penelope pileata]|nr:UBQL1 protein [Penelope pileata]